MGPVISTPIQLVKIVRWPFRRALVTTNVAILRAYAHYNMNKFAKLVKLDQLGFTLIELMVVIVILGVLSMIGISAFTSSQVRSRDTKRKVDLANFQKALEFYYNDHNSFPLADAEGKIQCKAAAICEWGLEFSDDNGTIYMIRLPKEASGSRRYFYLSDGVDYRVYAFLENTEDSGLITPTVSTNCAGSGTPIECNYGIASVNTTP